MFKYVALDFDGTLLNEHHHITTRTIEVLRKLQEAGIVIILCSGRNISQMNFVAEKINTDQYNTYVISDNGGVITEIKDGKRSVLRNSKFKQEELKEIFKVVDGKTKTLIAFNDGKRYLHKINIYEMIRAYATFKEISKVGLPKEASKILCIDEVPKVERIYESVKADVHAQFPHLNVFRSVPRLIEITPEGSTKGDGLKIVFEREGWNLSELLVMGDGENDISMFEVAGQAVAMDNAFDTVKAEADEICLSNDKEGVADYLERIFTQVL